MDSQYKFGVKTKQRPPKNQILSMKMQSKLTNGAPDPTIPSLKMRLTTAFMRYISPSCATSAA